MKIIILTSIIVLLNLSNIFSQSYIDFFEGETVEYEKIEFEQYHLIYTPKNTNTPIKINQMKVKGYYSERDNVYYYQKNGFKEKISEGKLNVYSALYTEDIAASGGFFDPSGNVWYGGGSNALIYTKWYLEQDLKMKHFFNQNKRNSNKKEKKLQRETFRSAIGDDTLALKDFNLISAKPKIKNILAIIKAYNVRHFQKNMENEEIDTEYAKVIILRDGKQSKKSLEFTVNGKKYILENNSKIELLIPNNKSSLICITNSLNKACDLISSSSNFQNYFGLRLNKKENGFISKVNGNSNYFKTRLAYYEERLRK